MAAALDIRIDGQDREQVGPECVRDQAKADHVCAGACPKVLTGHWAYMTMETYKPAKYLTQVRHSRARRCLAQLRFGSHWLREETGRWVGLPQEARRCARCEAAQIYDAFYMALRCTYSACGDSHAPY